VGSISGSDPVNAPGVGKSGVGRAAVCVDSYVVHVVVVVPGSFPGQRPAWGR
jgi:hypothetical protein